MTTFVIVHGAFGGGWEWTPVAQSLRAMGHDVFTPTLSGMGERAHLGHEASLSTHMSDVVAVLEFEDLSDVVLCGASYGGMAVTWAADRNPERVSAVIYIDALVPEDGQAGIDLLPEGFRRDVLAQEETESDQLVAVPAEVMPPAGLIAEDARSRYIERMRPQPISTFTEPVRLSGAIEQVTRAFIRCTRSSFANDPVAPMGERAQARGWPYRELDTYHDPQLFDPVGTAAALDELATAMGI